MSSRSQIISSTSPQIERAWHLLTVLIRLGRPARLAELASRSELDSIFLSPDLVELSCRIPGSPISLITDRFVMVSEVAAEALDRFMDRASETVLPRVLFRVADERRDWGDVRLTYVRKRKVRPLEVGLGCSSVKRRLILTSEREDVTRDGQLGIKNSASKALMVHTNVADNLENGLSVGDSCELSSQAIAFTPFIHNYVNFLSSCDIKNADQRRDDESEMCDNAEGVIPCKELSGNSRLTAVQKEIYNNTQAIIVHNELAALFGNDGSLGFEHNAVISDAETVGRLKLSDTDVGSGILDKPKDKRTLLMETLGEDSCIVPAAPQAVSYEVNPALPISLVTENDSNGPSIEIGSLIGLAKHNEKGIATDTSYCETEGVPFKIGREQDNSAYNFSVHTASKLKSFAISSSAEPVTNVEQQGTFLDKPKLVDGITSTVGIQRSIPESNTRSNGNSPEREQGKRNERGAMLKQKLRRNTFEVPSKENRLEVTHNISKINSESKLLPNFNSFVIEEEEGSGGYGTVYRARRKEDGKIFAVKSIGELLSIRNRNAIMQDPICRCLVHLRKSTSVLQMHSGFLPLTGPHPNAHSHHVNNELKMLERFGGRNFVIKYEGSFKSEQSECFVLEHVEHDRPEVLKKEIDVLELQWYGYCMFRALASLHKQGIVHRDVKPGNFLFSRKLNKGYLIDFNLASDLHKKYSKSSRPGNNSNMNLDPLCPSNTKPTLYKQANGRYNRVLDSISKETTKDSRKIVVKNMKERSIKGHTETFHNIDNGNKYGSQAADSGVTSAKDPTSTKTHSADMLKQPIPYKGRKELINFVFESMQGPKHKEMTGPSSQRKRVAAPVSKMNSHLMMLTPMPLHSGGAAVSGAGTFNKGYGKQKKGPCVGTKGFRAPEVLFESCHQGCKIDIWSAGVTLLYLIIGKAPFAGDPEQNVKEVAKLRGSEDLWEVAKLHNCESSYPADLLDVKFLQSMELRDWCRMNTKRPEFLELIPRSLFDLIDRCLTVNPRCRISAEEALMHSFFAPCHESLKKQRLLRRAVGSDPGSSR